VEVIMPNPKKPQARKYYGSAHITKDYRGAKSINLVLDREEALKLTAAVATGGAKAEQITLTIWSEGRSSKITVSASTKALL
jgi:membrane-bound inhibitor of C-type lysozyme